MEITNVARHYKKNPLGVLYLENTCKVNKLAFWCFKKSKQTYLDIAGRKCEYLTLILQACKSKIDNTYKDSGKM